MHNEEIEKILIDHEHRITKLECKDRHKNLAVKPYIDRVENISHIFDKISIRFDRTDEKIKTYVRRITFSTFILYIIVIIMFVIMAHKI